MREEEAHARDSKDHGGDEFSVLLTLKVLMRYVSFESLEGYSATYYLPLEKLLGLLKKFVCHSDIIGVDSSNSCVGSFIWLSSCQFGK